MVRDGSLSRTYGLNLNHHFLLVLSMPTSFVCIVCNVVQCVSIKNKYVSFKTYNCLGVLRKSVWGCICDVHMPVYCWVDVVTIVCCFQVYVYLALNK